jgi:hypothetical protein
VELEQLDSKKFKKCDETSLREFNVLGVILISARDMFRPARVDDDLFDA